MKTKQKANSFHYTWSCQSRWHKRWLLEWAVFSEIVNSETYWYIYVLSYYEKQMLIAA